MNSPMRHAPKSVAVGAALLTAAAFAQAQSTIAQWSFSAAIAAPYNSPAPTVGTGTAITLGMDNTYNGGNTADDDVLLTAGVVNTRFSEYTWRIRGTPNNGWALFGGGTGAPEYTQGIELDVSTVGYQNITFSFDWYSTAQGIRDLQFQYNLNVNGGGGWQNFGGTSPTGTYLAVPNDYFAPDSPTITINLSTIPGANNNPNFGVRLVSAFDSTGNITNDYASATLSAGQSVPYNNTSGNWRFGNLTFTGYSNVPEPSLLSITQAGNSAIVSWPYPSTGYVLQTNENLATTNWGNFTGSVTTNVAGTSNRVTITPSAGTLFFRLGP